MWVEYALTLLGETQIEPLSALRDWSVAYIEQVLAARAAFDAGTGQPPEPLT